MSHPRATSFDGWVLRIDLGELAKDGRKIRLQDQPLQILDELLSRPGELVTREQLIARLWPTGVVDFDTGLNSAVRKLRVALQEAETPRYIETVPRRGYRFIGAIDSLAVPPGEPAVVASTASSGESSATVGQLSPDPRSRRLHTAHSIAVLPFVNMSGDPQQEYFCDGMAEELLNSLVRISELKVAARTSAFAFKGKDMEVGEIDATFGRSLENVRLLRQLPLQQALADLVGAQALRRRGQPHCARIEAPWTFKLHERQPLLRHTRPAGMDG
jgi:DNA-binding winged helix-turn-helix (wHTH) protein